MQPGELRFGPQALGDAETGGDGAGQLERGGLDRGAQLLGQGQSCLLGAVRQEQNELTRAVEVKHDEPFVLHPGEFALGSTYEVVTLPDDVAARLEGKSSLGRLGLLTHSTAGFIDPGFKGTVVLELSNVSNLPILLRTGMKVAQLVFQRLDKPAERPYGHPDLKSKYQGQAGAVASKYNLNTI